MRGFKVGKLKVVSKVLSCTLIAGMALFTLIGCSSGSEQQDESAQKYPMGGAPPPVFTPADGGE